MTMANAAAEAGRARAESLMVDTCQVVTMSATATTDPVTGLETYTPTVRYTGMCRVRPNYQNRQAEFGDQQVQVLSHLVSLPVSATAVAVDDEVVVTASLDSSLVGKRLRIRSVARGTHVTARRLACEEVT